jgi:hypothetical protein
VLLGIPAGEVADESPAERLEAVLVQVRLRDRTEELDPLLGLMEPVGVVDDVPHLVAEIAEDVGAASPLDVPAALGVQGRQLGRAR